MIPPFLKLLNLFLQCLIFFIELLVLLLEMLFFLLMLEENGAQLLLNMPHEHFNLLLTLKVEDLIIGLGGDVAVGEAWTTSLTHRYFKYKI